LDRRGRAITELEATNEDLAYTIDTLKSELIQSHADSEHVHSELESLRLRAFDTQKSSVDEFTNRERALREAQEDLERVRMEREEWEGEAMRERVRREEVASRLGQIEFEYAAVKEEREIIRDERDREAESAANLHAVLEEFQAGTLSFLPSPFRDLLTRKQQRKNENYNRLWGIWNYNCGQPIILSRNSSNAHYLQRSGQPSSSSLA
jgi:predicted nuclease with TOPRIM domain